MKVTQIISFKTVLSVCADCSFLVCLLCRNQFLVFHKVSWTMGLNVIQIFKIQVQLDFLRAACLSTCQNKLNVEKEQSKLLTIVIIDFLESFNDEITSK